MKKSCLTRKFSACHGVPEPAAKGSCRRLSPAPQKQRPRILCRRSGEPDGIFGPVLSVTVQRDNYVPGPDPVSQPGKRQFECPAFSRVDRTGKHIGKGSHALKYSRIRRAAPVVYNNNRKTLLQLLHKRNQCFPGSKAGMTANTMRFTSHCSFFHEIGRV